jgi:uncharacterized protein (DUF111 family)
VKARDDGSLRGEATVLYLNLSNGAGGDMLAAALLSLLDPRARARVREHVKGVAGLPVRLAVARVDGPIRGVRLRQERALSAPISFTDMRRAVARSPLAESAKERALSILSSIQSCEERLHGHFEPGELATLDTLVEVAAFCACLSALGCRVVASPVALGVGHLESHGGRLPAPSPAALELLGGSPVRLEVAGHELTTPTAAAILAEVVESWELPGPVKPVKVAYAYGTKTSSPLQAILAEDLSASLARQAGVWVVQTNLDDVTPEVVGATREALTEVGALDAWIEQAVGKKGRPCMILTALAETSALPAVVETLVFHTGTLGVRYFQVERAVAQRATEKVELAGHEVAIKRSPFGAKAEWEEVARLAKELGVGYASAKALAEASYLARRPGWRSRPRSRQARRDGSS